MSLHVLADHMASKGRGPDSMLVHMSPREVAGLHALALKHGGSLTVNPDTGLPEAGFLDKLLPTIIGAGLTIFGGVPPHIAAAMVGGVETVRTGSLERGLMAGFGAYGGAGLGESIIGAGPGGLAAADIAAQQAAGSFPTLVEGATQEQILKHGADVSALRDAAVSRAGDASLMSKASAGMSSIASKPALYGSDLIKYGSATLAPILADQMVPTTTKAPPVSPSFIRQKRVNPDGTVTDLTPVNAADFGSRNFSDIYRGYNGGGIVALADGGVAHYENGGLTPEQARQMVEAQYATIGRTGVGTGANQIDQSGLQGWTDALVRGDFKAADLGSRFSTAVTDYMAQNPADQYTEYVKAYQANQAGTGANLATTGGITNLATTGGTSLADAQAQVNNMYLNVLGRNADPEGLKFWSGAIAAGRSPESIYQDFLTGARANTELVTADQIRNKTFAEATTPYKGYTSADTTNIVDEWVRNTLGREPTELDKQQQWYKDAFTSMSTQGQAKGLYGQFQDYAKAEIPKVVADRIKEIDAELRAKGLTEIDLLAQTGKTKQQLASEGIDLSRNLIGASQLSPLGARAALDLKAKLTALTPITNTSEGSVVPRTVTNPYGNATNPGDLTFNPDGSTTVTPNIPYRPEGGFPDINAVKNAWTVGGGSLGYTSPVIKTPEEHEAAYNTLTGDSEAAYRYLMGIGANPVKSSVGQISKPYAESVLGYPASTNKMYNYDATTGKMVRNPDYVAPGRDSKGNVTYGMSLSEIKKYLSGKPLEGQELYNWAQENGASAQDIADATGRKLSEVYAEFRDGAKKAKKAAEATATDTGTYDGGGGMATGGMTGYAVGGGLGSLGSYSDGGRLLKGPGDGVSDSIPATIGAKNQPARLADGEFVVPARIVSELGNGSTDAGAKKLYAMMDRVQKARGKTTGKNKVAANSRADKYLPA